MDDDEYKLRVESRLSKLETQVDDVIRIVQDNAKSVSSLERTVARTTLLMPALSAALFVIGLLVGTKIGGL